MMVKIYPTTFPVPTIDGFQIDVSMGAVHVDMPGYNVQRRIYKTMPQKFTLAFILTEEGLATWHEWVSLYAFEWIQIDLPSLYAGAISKSTRASIVRFVSGANVTAVTNNHYRVTVQAEMSPQMIKQFLDVT